MIEANRKVRTLASILADVLAHHGILSYTRMHQLKMSSESLEAYAHHLEQLAKTQPDSRWSRAWESYVVQRTVSNLKGFT